MKRHVGFKKGIFNYLFLVPINDFLWRVIRNLMMISVIAPMLKK